MQSMEQTNATMCRPGKVRAARRFNEERAADPKANFEATFADMAERDRRDHDNQCVVESKSRLKSLLPRCVGSPA